MPTKVENLTDEQLDVLVAERVMGWDLWQWSADQAPQYLHGQWHPTTNIACAFQVIEQLADTGRYWFHVENMGPSVDGTPRYYRCHVSWREPGESRIHPKQRAFADAPTAPRAISIAACYACGVTEVE